MLNYLTEEIVKTKDPQFLKLKIWMISNLNRRLKVLKLEEEEEEEEVDMIL